MVEGEISTCVNLSTIDLHAIEALCAIEKIDQTQLLKELIEDGLQERAIRLYEASKISSGKGRGNFRGSLKKVYGNGRQETCSVQLGFLKHQGIFERNT